MNKNFSAAIRRAVGLTRASNVMAATRVIRMPSQDKEFWKQLKLLPGTVTISRLERDRKRC